MSDATKHGPGDLPAVDVSERGAPKDGVPQVSNRRLFMQLLVFEHPSNFDAALHQLEEALTLGGVPAVLYADANHPQGLGLLTFSEDPAHFVTPRPRHRARVQPRDGRGAVAVAAGVLDVRANVQHRVRATSPTGCSIGRATP